MFRQNLYTYSFIKTLYDQKKDFLVAFAPLIYDGIPTDSCVPIEQIQTTIENKRGLKFPLHIIGTVLARGKREGFVTTHDQANLFCLSEKGVALVGEIEDARDVERRINALGADLRRYFQEKNVKKTEQEIAALLQTFVDTNLSYLVDLFGNEEGVENIEISKADEQLILGYIQEVTTSKPAHFSTLKELIYGSIIASLVYVRSTTELTELEGANFQNARVYLDTNIVFSALGFDNAETTKAALELLNLIKSAGLELWVFDFTVDEMCGLFRVYSVENHKYPKGVKIDSIFSAFKQKGFGASDIIEMIGDIEGLLSKLDIRVDPTPDVNLKDYESDNEQIRGRIGAAKSDKSLANINHDLAAIDYIRDLRKHRSIRRIEDPKAIFLTANKSFHNVCVTSFDHLGKGTIPETILDRLFANILWLKNPSIDLPINLMIATHSKDLLIDRRIWERFYSVLAKMKNEGTVTDDRAATLFYNNNLASELSGFSRSDTAKINDAFVTEQIEKAAKVVESVHADLTQEKRELQESLFASQKELEETRKISLQIESAREQTKEIARRWSGYLLHPAVFAVCIGLGFVEIYILIYLANSLGWENVALELFLGGAVSLVAVDWILCKWMKEIIYPKMYLFIKRELLKIFVSRSTEK